LVHGSALRLEVKNSALRLEVKNSNYFQINTFTDYVFFTIWLA